MKIISADEILDQPLQKTPDPREWRLGGWYGEKKNFANFSIDCHVIHAGSTSQAYAGAREHFVVSDSPCQDVKVDLVETVEGGLCADMSNIWPRDAYTRMIHVHPESENYIQIWSWLHDASLRRCKVRITGIIVRVECEDLAAESRANFRCWNGERTCPLALIETVERIRLHEAVNKGIARIEKKPDDCGFWSCMREVLAQIF